eukprot:275214_1
MSIRNNEEKEYEEVFEEVRYVDCDSLEYLSAPPPPQQIGNVDSDGAIDNPQPVQPMESEPVEPEQRSINDTLPPDIVRHVLSFNTFPHNSAINATNKQWNKCSAQIKAIQNREREQVVDNYPIKYNEEVNNEWIVDPNRTQ